MPRTHRKFAFFDMNEVLDRSPTTPGGENVVLQRSNYLLKNERTLIQLCMRGDLSRRQIASLIGLPAGTVCRKIQRIATRLYNPMTSALLDPTCPLPNDHRTIAIQHFVQGQHVRRLANLHGMSEATIRKMLSFVRGWQEGAGRNAERRTRNAE